MMEIRVSVIIPNYNGMEYLDNCINSLRGQDFKNFEIIVVDDASADESVAYLKTCDDIRLFCHKENVGFAASVNDGIKEAKAEYVLLLNNDTVAGRSFVGELYKAVRTDEKVFSVSAKMLSMKDPTMMDDAGDYYCSLGWQFTTAKDRPASEYRKATEVFSACAGAAIYKRDLLLELGGFDEAHFAYLEDVDLGYRAKWRGYRNLYWPRAVVKHAGSAVSGSRHNEFKVRLTARNNIYLIYKNMPLWQIILNAPQLFAGILIKMAFFAVKGLGAAYLEGLLQGVRLCGNQSEMRPDYSKIPMPVQIRMEMELLANTFRRILMRVSI